MIFSIIIPTFNRRSLLAECLKRVFQQDFLPSAYEVIVVVDGSTDGTSEVIKEIDHECRLIVIEQQNKGPASARNAGAAAAKGKYLLFLDDDIFCSPQLLREHFAGHTGPLSVVHGPIFVASTSPRTIVASSTKTWYESYYQRFGATTPLNVLNDGFLISNASMPRLVFQQCGGFDTKLTLLEDVELGIRLQKFGVAFVYRSTATAWENFSKSTYSFLAQDGFEYGRAEVIICDRHSEYRRHCSIANLGRGVLWKRLIRRAVATTPFPSQILFLPLLWMLETIHSAWSLQIGIRLLGLGHRWRVLQGACFQAGSFRDLHHRYGRRLPVLLYHNISNIVSKKNPELTLSRRKFERQIRWLARRRYTAISPHDWFQWVTVGTRLPAKPILLTFDDGYEDVASNALPVLEHYGFRACIFAVTSQIGGVNAWDQPDGLCSSRLMNAADIRRWANHGIDFGAHGRNHFDLTQVSFDAATLEVLGSAEDLRRLVGQTVTSFAYPFGKFTRDLKNLVSQSFEIGFSTDEGINELQTDLGALHRLFIPGNSWFADFVCYVGIGWSPTMGLRSRLRLRSRSAGLWRTIVEFHGTIKGGGRVNVVFLWKRQIRPGRRQDTHGGIHR